MADAKATEGNRHVTFAFLLVLPSALLAPVAAAAPPSATHVDMGVRFSVYRVADLQVTPVDFGSLMTNGQSGRVDMDQNGKLTFSGGVFQVAGFSQAGTLTLDGDNVMATITLDPRVDMGGGVAYVPSASTTSVQLTGKPQTIRIYGSILLPAGVQTHEYSGVLTVSVTYN